ncbi:hypothetical protein, partial [Methylomonas methanica]|uniref:hypothetical protein n=1 Tax=Methylomonas methanica TaxID=421 RepID=UPI001A9E89E3
CTLNEAFHLHSRLIGREIILPNRAFLHSLGRFLPLKKIRLEQGWAKTASVSKNALPDAILTLGLFSF